MNVKPKTIDEFLKARQSPQGSVPICMRADVLAEIAELERQIEKSQNSDDADDPRMATRIGATEADLADQIRALETIAEEFTLDLRLQAVPALRWSQTVAKYTTDLEPILNTRTGQMEPQEKLDLDGLFRELFPESVVSPEMTEGQRTDFLGGLSEGQWSAIGNLMFDLNRGSASVGKSLRASMVLRTRSEKPEPAEQ